jgi:hypothetical protein
MYYRLPRLNKINCEDDMKKSIKLASVLVCALGVSGAALAANSPYAYVYGVFANPVSKAVLTNVVANSPNTQVSLPAGGLPSPLSMNNKNQGLVTAYTTSPSQKMLSVTLTYIVTAGVGPSTCTVTVETPNIYDKTQQLNASVTNGCMASTLFNPIYSTNSEDGDQVVTVNWKLTQ